MPARVVVVLNDPKIADAAVFSLVADGLNALAVHDAMTALNLLQGAEDVELLVTSSYFGTGKPTGAALALMTRKRRRQLKVILVASDSEKIPLLEDIGRVMVEPVSPSQVWEAVHVVMRSE